MAGETYGLLVPPTGSTFVAGHTARVHQIEQSRKNFAVLGRQRQMHLGGDEMDGHTSESYERLRSAMPIDLCEEDYRGLTLTLVVLMRVANASGTVQVRLRNTDDGATVAETTVENDTALTRYTAAVTLPTGVTPKRCELQIVAGDETYPAFAMGGLLVEL
jgi:hypothetical protein